MLIEPECGMNTHLRRLFLRYHYRTTGCTPDPGLWFFGVRDDWEVIECMELHSLATDQPLKPLRYGQSHLALIVVNCVIGRFDARVLTSARSTSFELFTLRDLLDRNALTLYGPVEELL